MSAAAPNPQKLILLAAVGIGVYWFMSRRAHAAAAPTPSGQAVANPNLASSPANTLANTVGAIARLFNSGITPGTYDGRAATPYSPAISGGNNPSAYNASSAVDGAPVNIPNQSTYDATGGASYGIDDSFSASWLGS